MSSTTTPTEVRPSVEELIERNKSVAHLISTRAASSLVTEPRIEVRDVLTSNESIHRLYAAGHKPIPTLMARTKNNPKENGPHVLIISCLDSRANPMEILALTPRECIVIRNVAGRFATAASDIAALDTLFSIRRVVLLHHNNCGASHITNQAVLDGLREKTPDFVMGDDADAAGVADLASRLPAKEDNDKSLREDLARVKQCRFLRKELLDNFVGLWLDVDTGLVRRVFPEEN